MGSSPVNCLIAPTVSESSGLSGTSEQTHNSLPGSIPEVHLFPSWLTPLIAKQAVSPSTSCRKRDNWLFPESETPSNTKKFLQGIQDILNARNIEYSNISEANEWIDIKQENGFGQEINIRILPLVIPFDTTGALETFLLEAIAEQDEYDKEIINKGGVFVDSIDPEQRYLKKRRYATKAKFDVYFSVRTPIDQFIERRNILKDVRWENYILIQHDFSKLSEL